MVNKLIPYSRRIPGVGTVSFNSRVPLTQEQLDAIFKQVEETHRRQAETRRRQVKSGEIRNPDVLPDFTTEVERRLRKEEETLRNRIARLEAEGGIPEFDRQRLDRVRKDLRAINKDPLSVATEAERARYQTLERGRKRDPQQLFQSLQSLPFRMDDFVAQASAASRGKVEPGRRMIAHRIVGQDGRMYPLNVAARMVGDILGYEPAQLLDPKSQPFRMAKDFAIADIEARSQAGPAAQRMTPDAQIAAAAQAGQWQGVNPLVRRVQQQALMRNPDLAQISDLEAAGRLAWQGFTEPVTTLSGAFGLYEKDPDSELTDAQRIGAFAGDLASQMVGFGGIGYGLSQAGRAASALKSVAARGGLAGRAAGVASVPLSGIAKTGSAIERFVLKPAGVFGSLLKVAVPETLEEIPEAVIAARIRQNVADEDFIPALREVGNQYREDLITLKHILGRDEDGNPIGVADRTIGLTNQMFIGLMLGGVKADVARRTMKRRADYVFPSFRGKPIDETPLGVMYSANVVWRQMKRLKDPEQRENLLKAARREVQLNPGVFGIPPGSAPKEAARAFTRGGGSGQKVDADVLGPILTRTPEIGSRWRPVDAPESEFEVAGMNGNKIAVVPVDEFGRPAMQNSEVVWYESDQFADRFEMVRETPSPEVVQMRLDGLRERRESLISAVRARRVIPRLAEEALSRIDMDIARLESVLAERSAEADVPAAVELEQPSLFDRQSDFAQPAPEVAIARDPAPFDADQVAFEADTTPVETDVAAETDGSPPRRPEQKSFQLGDTRFRVVTLRPSDVKIGAEVYADTADGGLSRIRVTQKSKGVLSGVVNPDRTGLGETGSVAMDRVAAVVDGDTIRINPRYRAVEDGLGRLGFERVPTRRELDQQNRTLREMHDRSTADEAASRGDTNAEEFEGGSPDARQNPDRPSSDDLPRPTIPAQNSDAPAVRPEVDPDANPYADTDFSAMTDEEFEEFLDALTPDERRLVAEAIALQADLNREADAVPTLGRSAAAARRGGQGFAQWSASLIARLGEMVKKFLQDAWNYASRFGRPKEVERAPDRTQSAKRNVEPDADPDQAEADRRDPMEVFEKNYEMTRVEPSKSTDRSDIGIELTPEEAAGSAEAALYDGEIPKFKRRPSVRVLSEYLTQRALAVRKAVWNEYDPEVSERLARILARETILALKDSNNALEWYRNTLSNALKTASILHPELKTDEDARFAFTVIMAITSNGQSVPLNTRYTFELYDQYKKNVADGESRPFPEVGYGVQSKAMKKSFVLLNDMISEMGQTDTRLFLNTTYSVKQLRAMGFKVSGERSDVVLPASLIFGPKIGGGFFRNLQGYFDVLTMDRWFMRTWGRITGTLVKEDPEIADRYRRSFRELLEKDRIAYHGGNNRVADASTDSLVSEFPITKRRIVDSGDESLAELFGFDSIEALATSGLPDSRKFYVTRKDLMENDAALDMFAKVVLQKYSSGGFKNRVEFNKRAKLLAEYVGATLDAPKGMKQRAHIRDVMARSQEILADLGYRIEMATQQALLWYLEKDLYTAHGVGSKAAEPTDYFQEAVAYVKSKGISQETIDAELRTASESGSGGSGAQQVAGGADSGGVEILSPQYKAGGYDSETAKNESIRLAVLGLRFGPIGNRLGEGDAGGRSRAFTKLDLKAHQSVPVTAGPSAVSGAAGKKSAPRTQQPKKQITIDGKKYLVPAKAVYSIDGRWKRTLSKFGVGTATMIEVDGADGAQAFHRAISSAKSSKTDIGAQVTVYSEAEYMNDRLFLSPDGKQGFALRGDDIISVFKHGKSKVKRVTVSMLQLAIEEGGRRLDCFDTALPHIYSLIGFRAVGRIPWNDEYAPPGWNYSAMKEFNGGRPDVVFMVLDPTHRMRYKAGDGEMLEDYDDGVSAQASRIKELKKKYSVYRNLEGGAGKVDLTGLSKPVRGKAQIAEVLDGAFRRGELFGGDRRTYRLAKDFLEAIPEKVLDSLGVSLADSLGDSTVKGVYIGGRNVVGLVRNLTSNDPRGAAYTVAHELSHHLEKFVGQRDRDLLYEQFKRERESGRFESVRRQRAYGRMDDAEQFSEWFADTMASRGLRRAELESMPVWRRLTAKAGDWFAGMANYLFRRGMTDHAMKVWDNLTGEDLPSRSFDWIRANIEKGKMNESHPTLRRLGVTVFRTRDDITFDAWKAEMETYVKKGTVTKTTYKRLYEEVSKNPNIWRQGVRARGLTVETRLPDTKFDAAAETVGLPTARNIDNARFRTVFPDMAGIVEPDVQTREKLWAESERQRQAFESQNPGVTWGDHLTEEILKNRKKSVTAEEQLAIARELSLLRSAYLDQSYRQYEYLDELSTATDQNRIEELKRFAADAESMRDHTVQRIEMRLDALKRVGTATARALNARKFLLEPFYADPAALLIESQNRKGRNLTASEKSEVETLSAENIRADVRLKAAKAAKEVKAKRREIERKIAETEGGSPEARIRRARKEAEVLRGEVKRLESEIERSKAELDKKIKAERLKHRKEIEKLREELSPPAESGAGQGRVRRSRPTGKAESEAEARYREKIEKLEAEVRRLEKLAAKREQKAKRIERDPNYGGPVGDMFKLYEAELSRIALEMKTAKEPKRIIELQKEFERVRNHLMKGSEYLESVWTGRMTPEELHELARAPKGPALDKSPFAVGDTDADPFLRQVREAYDEVVDDLREMAEQSRVLLKIDDFNAVSDIYIGLKLNDAKAKEKYEKLKERVRKGDEDAARQARLLTKFEGDRKVRSAEVLTLEDEFRLTVRDADLRASLIDTLEQIRTESYRDPLQKGRRPASQLQELVAKMRKEKEIRAKIQDIMSGLDTGSYFEPPKPGRADPDPDIAALQKELEEARRLARLYIESLEPQGTVESLRTMLRANVFTNVFARTVDYAANLARLAVEKNPVSKSVDYALDRMFFPKMFDRSGSAIQGSLLEGFRPSEAFAEINQLWSRKTWQGIRDTLRYGDEPYFEEKWGANGLRLAARTDDPKKKAVLQKIDRVVNWINRTPAVTDVPFRNAYRNGVTRSMVNAMVAHMERQAEKRGVPFDPDKTRQALLENRNGELDAILEIAEAESEIGVFANRDFVSGVIGNYWSVDTWKNKALARGVPEARAEALGQIAVLILETFITRFPKIFAKITGYATDFALGGAKAAGKISMKKGFGEDISMEDRRRMVELVRRNMTGAAMVYLASLLSEDDEFGRYDKERMIMDYGDIGVFPLKLRISEIGGPVNVLLLNITKRKLDKMVERGEITEKERSTVLTRQFRQFLFNQPIVTGSERFLDYLVGENPAIGKLFGSALAVTFVPGAIRAWARERDEERNQVRIREVGVREGVAADWRGQARMVVNRLKENIPGLRETLPRSKAGVVYPGLTQAEQEEFRRLNYAPSPPKPNLERGEDPDFFKRSIEPVVTRLATSYIKRTIASDEYRNAVDLAPKNPRAPSASNAPPDRKSMLSNAISEAHATARVAATLSLGNDAIRVLEKHGIALSRTLGERGELDDREFEAKRTAARLFLKNALAEIDRDGELDGIPVGLRREVLNNTINRMARGVVRAALGEIARERDARADDMERSMAATERKREIESMSTALASRLSASYLQSSR